jgi:pyruvate dehydrogenase E1 component beta subunit
MIINCVRAIKDALAEEMRRDAGIFVMGEDVETMGGVFGCTKGLLAEFGHDRIRNTPISEAAFTGAGLGAALTGLRPVIELQYADFILCAMDQVINQIAKYRYASGGKAKVPLVIRAQQGSGRGNGVQHSQSLETLFCHFPGLKVVMPSTPYDTKGLLKTAIRDDNPVMFFEHKLLYQVKGEVPEEEYCVPFGRADIKKPGKDVTIIAVSWMVNKALAAAEELLKMGIDAEIMAPRTLVPLDEDTILESVRKTGRVVIVHESHEFCGIGSELAYRINDKAFDYLDAPVQRVCGLQVPVPYSRVLENKMIPSETRIISAVRKVLYLEEE